MDIHPGGRGIPALLDFVGIEGVRLINTPFAVLVGIVCGYLPLMIFPIYVSLEKLDKRLLEASSDLGADRMRTFLQVTLPLPMPGIITGSLLVFIQRHGPVADRSIDRPLCHTVANFLAGHLSADPARSDVRFLA